jgi:PAS domain S-box-containing protein
MKPKHFPLVINGLTAAAMLAIAFGVSRLDGAHGASPVIIPFVIPVLFGAVYGGLATGLLATLVGALLAAYLFMPPIGEVWLEAPEEWARLITFLVVGVLVSFLADSRRRTLAVREALLEKQSQFEQEIQFRKQTEEQMRVERDRFFVTLNSIGDAALVVDAKERVQLINPVAQALLGWTQEEARGRALAEVFRIINEATRLPVENPVDKVLATGAIVGLANHTLLISKDGREIPIDDSAAPIRGEDGRILGVILIFRDITERRAAEAVLKEAARHKDEFLAMLAHELRNPLAPIVSATQILHRKSDSETHRTWACGVIERQVSHLSHLVDDLLDVSRINSGKVTLDRRALELAEAVRHAVETSQPLIEAHRHTLTVSLPETPVWIEGDPIRLAQIVSNLLNNAAKYSEEGGDIHLSAVVEEGRAVIRVKDKGIGIGPDLLPRIFDLFTQADRSLDRSKGGLGIGLSLVKRLAELHGGTVEAKSEGLGRGSEFIVRLPLFTAIPAGSAMKFPRLSAAGPGSAPRVPPADGNADATEDFTDRPKIEAGSSMDETLYPVRSDPTRDAAARQDGFAR